MKRNGGRSNRNATFQQNVGMFLVSHTNNGRVHCPNYRKKKKKKR